MGGCAPVPACFGLRASSGRRLSPGHSRLPRWSAAPRTILWAHEPPWQAALASPCRQYHVRVVRRLVWQAASRGTARAADGRPVLVAEGCDPAWRAGAPRKVCVILPARADACQTLTPVLCVCRGWGQACVGCQCVWHRVFDGQARGRVQAGCGWLLPSLAGRCSQESMCGILDARAGACLTATPVLCVCRG